MKPPTDHFPARLRAILDSSGLTVAEAAALAGLTPGAVHHLLNGTRGGNPRWSTVQALARALGVSTDALRS